MLKFDISMREVDPPPLMECACGHSIKEEALYNNKPIRFFKVNGKGLKGTYCELCIIIAFAKKKDNCNK